MRKRVLSTFWKQENKFFLPGQSRDFLQRRAEYKQVKMRLGEGVAGQVIREAVTINIGDVKTDPRFLPSTSLPAFSSLLVAPVQSGGKQIGTISVQSEQMHAFSSKDSELLDALGIQACWLSKTLDCLRAHNNG